MSGRIRIGVIAAAAVIVGSSAAVADEPKYQLEEVSPVGKPEGYRPGVSTRFAVWYENSEWHVRATTKAKGAHGFSGTIQIIGGKMTSLQPVAIEGKGAKKKNQDFGAWNPQGTIFKFKFSNTKGTQDGFDLQVSKGATAIKLDLRVADEQEPDKIFIGSTGAHPKSSTFYLPAHPEK